MQNPTLIGAVCLLLQAATDLSLSQARFSGIGDIPGGLNASYALGVSGDGKTVVGYGHAPDKALPVLWLDGGVGIVGFGGDVIADNHAGMAMSISDDGEVIAGEYEKTYWPPNWMVTGSRRGWMTFTGNGSLTPVFTFPESTYTEHHMTALSGDGSTLVGTYDVPDDSLYPLPCILTGGSRTYLTLPYGIIQGWCKGASFDASVVAVEGYDHKNPNYPYWAFVWKNGTFTELLRDGPGHPITVHGISADGSTVIGSYQPSTSQRAFRLRVSGGTTGIPDPGAKAFGVSANGEIVVGETRYDAANGGTSAFIWDEVRGIRLVKDVLEKQFGLSLSGWRLLAARGVSADGSVVVGVGKNPAGEDEGWFAFIPFVSVSGPYANEVLTPGQRDTITWKVGGQNRLNIYLSTDSGKTRQPLALDVPATDRRYVWTVPDTISNECIIFVEGVEDARVKSNSEVFTIKGYHLIRQKPGNYQKWEVFDPAVHGWNFSNQDQYMWPTSWWLQFDYWGTDPFTGKPYPADEPFITARRWDFPDWPLLVRTFGQSACYWSTTHGIYDGTALHFWEGKRKEWRGSCYGFAVSTLLAFNHASDFRVAFPEMPPANGIANSYVLSAFDTSAGIRMTINSLMLSQSGEPHKSYYKAKVATTTPKQTVLELGQFLGSTSGYRKPLSLVPDNADGGHEVVAYRVSADPAGPPLVRIYVNDSILPGRNDTWIVVDTVTNSWSYQHIRNTFFLPWGGTAGLTLDDPVSQYLDPPAFPSAGDQESRTSSKFLSTAGVYDLYMPQQADILITDPAGRSLGTFGDTLIRNIPDGLPMRPDDADQRPPGYEVPKGEYAVTVGRVPDTTLVVKVFSDSLLYGYRRHGVDSTQTDDIRIVGGGINVKNRDAAVKRFAVESVIPLTSTAGEQNFGFGNLTIAQGESIRVVYPFTSDNILLFNYGSGTILYDVKLRYVQRQYPSWLLQKFEHRAVELKPHSTHRLDPSWSTMQSENLRIDVDTANTGTFNVLLYLSNQITDVGETERPGQPLEFALHQNYPNPFNPSTVISFQLPVVSNVKLVVYDILGREVSVLVNERREAGSYEVKFDATGLPSGVYLYRLQTDDVVQTRKLLLLR